MQLIVSGASSAKAKSLNAQSPSVESDRGKYLTNCDASMNRCMRIWREKGGEKEVENKCTNEHTCDGEKEACQDSSGKCKLSCCDQSGCNASSAFSSNVFVMTACSVLGLGLLKWSAGQDQTHLSISLSPWAANTFHFLNRLGRKYVKSYVSGPLTNWRKFNRDNSIDHFLLAFYVNVRLLIIEKKDLF